MRNCLVFAVFVFVVWSAAFAAQDLAVPVQNSSFEDVTAEGRPVAWNGDPAVYQVDDQVAHTGKRSLRFVNADANRYVLCTQPAPLRAGWMYEFSVWVKTKGLQGDDSGATICLEWGDKDGKYLGGAYPPGVKGDQDWTFIHGISGRVPAEAASCTVTVYCRQHMTGTAWFDDVSLKRAFADPLTAVMTRPNYRGWLRPDGPATVEFRAWLDAADLDRKFSDLALVVSICDDKDHVLASRTSPAADGALPGVPVPKDLPPGSYVARVSLLDKVAGRTLSTRSDRLVKLPVGPKPYSYIDEYSRLIVDGKPFLPLGCYWSAGEVKEDTIKVFADSPFNCFMPYGEMTREQMDLAQKYGLKVLYSIKDSFFGSTWCPPDIKSADDERPWVERHVKGFRDHPALLGWYLNDELPLDVLDRLIAHQRWVEELDPNHPTWVVLYQFNQVRYYVQSFDAIGTDPYPIPNPPLMAGAWARITREEVAGSRPVWMVPQIMNWKCYDPKGNGRTPTFEEMRSMAWQCLCEGANGLVFYCFHDLRRDPDTSFDVQWERVRRMAAEIKKWSPVLLSVDKPTSVSVKGRGLHSIARASNGHTYLFLVNDGYDARTAAIRLRPGATVRRLADGAVLKATAVGRLDEDITALDMAVYDLNP
jgi:hypothetical protein